MCVSTTSLSVVSECVQGCVYTQSDALALVPCGTCFSCYSVRFVVNAAFLLLASYKQKVAQKSSVKYQKSGRCPDVCYSVWEKKNAILCFQECS